MLLKCLTTTASSGGRVGSGPNATTSIASSSSEGGSVTSVLVKSENLRSNGVKMTVGNGGMTQRAHRKVLRIPSKRHPGKALPGKLHSMTRIGPGKIIKSHPGKRIMQRPTPPPCDNSNDSGLGFDHHLEMQYSLGARNAQNSRSSVTEEGNDDGEKRDIAGKATTKRRKVNKKKVQVDDDSCSNDAFTFSKRAPKAGKSATSSAICVQNSSNPFPPNNKIMAAPRHSLSRPLVRRAMGPVNLQSQIGGVSKSGQYQLQIVAQPEQQHRARYQTEGSRGAVKDRSGNGFPIVKLVGYNKPTVLQVFIGTDVDRVAPHMFYQACKVSGKNSTPCVEKKVDGTMVIELELKPEQDMTVTCDCVGILKERNVDVEHRFPDQSTPRSKKKSTRCRMVFRTIITNDDGSTESLQVCSQQIICTQPPGVPEICRKSLTSCPASGGLELFVIGKNFSKDTRVVFQTQKLSSGEVIWQEMVIPDKEYLQQTHLICTVPPYMTTELPEPVNVHLFIAASGKKSESHNFVYTPNNASAGALAAATTRSLSQQQDVRYDEQNSKNAVCPVMLWSATGIEPKNEIDSGMMPPPTTLPLSVRRPSSTGAILPDTLSPSSVVAGLKTEIVDENSQNSMGATDCNSNDYDGRSPDAGVLYGTKMHATNIELMDESSNLSMIVNENSMDMSSVYPTTGHAGSLLMPAVHAANELSAKVAAVQLHQFVNAGSTEAQTQISPAQTVQSVQKFLENNVSGGLFTTAPVGNVSTSSTTGAGIFSQISGINANRNTAMETNFMSAGPLAIQCDGASATDQILCNNSSPSSTSRSPLSQDVILNSQSVVTLSEVNGMNVLSSPNLPSATTQSDHTMSPDIIMNPTVSPSMLCTGSTGAHSPMLESQVPLLTIPQTAPEAMINSMISPILASPQADHKSPQTPTTTTSNTVHNMILNEILTSQQNTITTESMEALMSFNSATSMLQDPTPVTTHAGRGPEADGQQQPQQISPNATIFSEATAAAAHVVATAAIMAGASDMSATTTTAGSNMLSASVTDNLGPPNHIINNHEIRVSVNGDLHVQRVQSDIGLFFGNSRRTETMMQAAGLVQNELPNQAAKVDMAIVSNNIADGTPHDQQPTTGTTTIPQEIATMSDHDLISYINPSCFDQEFQ
ncbi:nuclear factor of activated T-cells 5 isoform X2 [Phlebotomus argentipes]|uniref:nuclear factor of activated T-cells 5 isoform X2 n=1 Tax=Phlebotomus argentipes TaxID=94469 RepID=UPI0028937A86|nr:nuclear factor of activated T-cells 5 isoform X2 [Phlebotomus argentipes]